MEGFSCQIAVNEVVNWLEKQKTTHPDRPFFLYLPFHEPHEPVASPQELVALYRDVAFTEEQAEYFANVHNVDLAVGRLLESLESLKLRNNTLIVFSSDNGPETLNRYKAGSRSWGRTGILRGMKLHTHDGGFHVAGIMNWPAGIREARGGTRGSKIGRHQSRPCLHERRSAAETSTSLVGLLQCNQRCSRGDETWAMESSCTTQWRSLSPSGKSDSGEPEEGSGC
jgi:hypothetical protein